MLSSLLGDRQTDRLFVKKMTKSDQILQIRHPVKERVFHHKPEKILIQNGKLMNQHQKYLIHVPVGLLVYIRTNTQKCLKIMTDSLLRF